MRRTLPPDGYTLLLADSGFTINIAFFKDPKYDALKNFDPISVVAETPYILVVNPGLSYSSSIKDFIAAAKAQPGKLTIGSAGSGSGTHMTGELFRLRAGINMIHVPYKSVGPALSDVVAGQIQSTISTAPVTLPLSKAGRVKILAAAAPKRSQLLPDVPTFAESGVNDVNVSNWYSVISVGGTPPAVIKLLNREIARASPRLTQRSASLSALWRLRAIHPRSFVKKLTTNCSAGAASSKMRGYGRSDRSCGQRSCAKSALERLCSA